MWLQPQRDDRLNVPAFIRTLRQRFEKSNVQRQCAVSRVLFDWPTTGRVSTPNAAYVQHLPHRMASGIAVALRL